MRVVLILWLMAALSPGLLCFASLPRPVSGYVPNKYIVEMTNEADDAALKRAGKDRMPHKVFYKKMRRMRIHFEVAHEYNTPGVIVGASIQLKTPDDAAKFSNISGYKIHPVMLISRPRILNEVLLSDPSDSRITGTISDLHTMTGVNKLHAQGIFGQGIKIGIIGTGIDYKHPSLGGAIGPSHKVIGGHDFCGDEFTGSNKAIPDEDPLDTCSGHGTMVAGTIAAESGKFGNISVAPQASIAAYRVFGCNGVTSDDVIIAAMERAYADGMDILTLSLDSSSSAGAHTVIASRFANLGLVITSPAGDNGHEGLWYGNLPWGSQDLISVGSINGFTRKVSRFSSYGPTFDIQMSPTLSAPGEHILSTTLIAKGGYALGSGTSLASSFVAGAAALVLQARGKKGDTPWSLRRIFQSTAIQLVNNSLLQTIPQAGAGLVEVSRAVNTRTIVSPAQILFDNAARSIIALCSVQIHNSHSDTVSYSLSHIKATSLNTFERDATFVMNQVQLADSPAHFGFHPQNFTLAPGASQTVVAFFGKPLEATYPSLPVYSGFIRITSTHEILHIPYLAPLGDLKRQAVIDTSGQFNKEFKFPFISKDDSPVDPGKFVSYSMKDEDILTLAYRLRVGSPLIRLDLCKQDTGIRRPLPTGLLFNWLWGNPGDPSIIGLLAESSYVPRNSNDSNSMEPRFTTYTFDGRFANMTRVPDGKYHILLRVLRMRGDPSEKDDYESWLSPAFGIKRTRRQ